MIGKEVELKLKYLKRVCIGLGWGFRGSLLIWYGWGFRLIFNIKNKN